MRVINPGTTIGSGVPIIRTQTFVSTIIICHTGTIVQTCSFQITRAGQLATVVAHVPLLTTACIIGSTADDGTASIDTRLQTVTSVCFATQARVACGQQRENACTCICSTVTVTRTSHTVYIHVYTNMNTCVYICIASVTIEAVLLYNNFIMYEALATDAILVETWILRRFVMRIKYTRPQDSVIYMSYCPHAHSTTKCVY